MHALLVSHGFVRRAVEVTSSGEGDAVPPEDDRQGPLKSTKIFTDPPAKKEDVDMKASFSYLGGQEGLVVLVVVVTVSLLIKLRGEC